MHCCQSRWVPQSAEKRKEFAKELFEDSKKMMQNGVRNVENCKAALKLANHAAFLNADDLL